MEFVDAKLIRDFDDTVGNVVQGAALRGVVAEAVAWLVDCDDSAALGSEQLPGLEVLICAPGRHVEADEGKQDIRNGSRRSGGGAVVYVVDLPEGCVDETPGDAGLHRQHSVSFSLAKSLSPSSGP
eukprot:CAMPEP_0172043680 /NCGR_PEP_ID=MMETSP1041-20130122/26392_1 /TAXON_ID=464988 /ORGANISM="Hemiselmis andersenii, Strain CCMP439" /LENGTH=125 /DNA_ID=CAMNT_0012702123 /DNA_START=558 /DNA_END=932 /DNA_ORIENTATION=+